MLDYLEVKKFHARHLAANADGTGKVEDAFYETMKMVYHKGVEDGKLAHLESEIGRIVGIDKRKGSNAPVKGRD